MDLPTLPPRARKYADVYVWTFVNFAETMPHPVSPMGWSLLETGFRHFTQPLRLATDSGYKPFEFLYGRVFWNLTPVFGSRFVFAWLDRTLEMIAPSIRATMKEIRESGRVRPRPIFTLTQKLVLGLQLAFLVPWMAARVAVAALRPAAVERGLDRLEAGLRGRGPAQTSDWRSGIRNLDRFLRGSFQELKIRFGIAGLLVMTVTALFARVAGVLMKSRSLNETLELLTPPRPSKTAEADLALGTLGYQAYLDRFGHRCPGEQDVYSPRPWDEPTGPWKPTEGSSLAARFADRARQRRENAEARLKSIGPIRRLIAAPLHRAASRFYPYREDGKHYVMLILGYARRRLVSIGRGLKAEGIVAEADDVFFLTYPELVHLASRKESLRGRIAGRRGEFMKYRDVRPPLVVTSEGIPPPPPSQPLRGDPVSPGIARGRARIVLDPALDGKLEAGEILVAPHTDPGWTPLFLRAAAVVTEVGGALSHGAVVAREFGLPAVANVTDATRILRNGEMIEVDGDRGEIRRLPY
jgi:phosphohistidine swiveling domain-containing protein